MTEAYFKQKLKSVMTDNKYDRRVTGRSRGKLDMHRLPKVPTGTTKVFTQKEARKGKDYNIVVLIDDSGSMSGSKIKTALQCGMVLERNFHGVGIHTAVVTFNSEVKVIKDFDQPIPADENKVRNEVIEHLEEFGTCTHTYEGLKAAYKLLEGRPTGEKIVVILTDGDPGCGGSCSEDRAYYYRSMGYPRFQNNRGRDYKDRDKETRASIRALVKGQHKVNTLSVGIGVRPVQVSKAIVVNRPDELFGKFIRMMEQEIKRG